eukprot:10564104-Alexandrium_andersonii.AAC.1
MSDGGDESATHASGDLTQVVVDAIESQAADTQVGTPRMSQDSFADLTASQEDAELLLQSLRSPCGQDGYSQDSTFEHLAAP